MVNRMIHTPSYLATATAGEYWTHSAAVITAGWYTNVSGNRAFDMTLDAQSGWTIGFRMSYAGTNTSWQLVQLFDGTTLHCDLRINQTTGLLFVTRNGTTIATGTTALASATEYYIEVQFVIADSPSGTAIVKIDGVTDPGINSTSLDTRNAGNASANVVSFFGTNAAGAQIKDIYINDNAGGVDDTFWGPIAVATLTATGAGNSATWDPLSSTNVSNVDESAMDGDTSYNSTSTNSETDSFVASNTGYASGTVKGVEWAAEMRRLDASGTARVARVYRISSTDYVGSDLVLQTSYRVVTERTRVSPATTSAWTVSELDGMEIGYRRTGA